MGKFVKGGPPTATTRRGNGPGHGGPAKGPGKVGGPGRPKGLRDGEGKRSVAAILIDAGAQQLAADAWLAIINNPAHPKHAEMVAKVAERMDGAPTQRLEVRDLDPDTMTDAELAAIAARGRRATDDAETDKD